MRQTHAAAQCISGLGNAGQQNRNEEGLNRVHLDDDELNARISNAFIPPPTSPSLWLKRLEPQPGEALDYQSRGIATPRTAAAAEHICLTLQSLLRVPFSSRLAGASSSYYSALPQQKQLLPACQKR